MRILARYQYQAVLLALLLIAFAGLITLDTSIYVGGSVNHKEQTEYEPFRNLVDVIPAKKDNNTIGVCVAVRTYYKQSTALITLLLSLREAASKVEPGNMSLYVYVVDTEGGGRSRIMTTL